MLADDPFTIDSMLGGRWNILIFISFLSALDLTMFLFPLYKRERGTQIRLKPGTGQGKAKKRKLLHPSIRHQPGQLNAIRIPAVYVPPRVEKLTRPYVKKHSHRAEEKRHKEREDVVCFSNLFHCFLFFLSALGIIPSHANIRNSLTATSFTTHKRTTDPDKLQLQTRGKPRCSSHLWLGGDAGLGVGDLDAEGLSLGEDVDTLPRGDGVGDPAVSCQPSIPTK